MRFVRDKGLTEKREMRVGTPAGIIVPTLEADGAVTVDMGVPQFEPARIPFLAERRALTYPLDVGGDAIEIARCRWAIRTPCSWSTTSTPRRCGRRAR